MDEIIHPDEKHQDLHFPGAGIDTSRAFSQQPNRPVYDKSYKRTSVDAVNVRAFDGKLNRMRGGSRPGLAKYISTRPTGSTVWIIQCIAGVTISNPDAES